MVDRGPRSRPQRQVFTSWWPRPVADCGTAFDDPTQHRHLAERLTGVGQLTGKRREVRRDERQVERCGPTDLGGGLDRARVASETCRLLGARAQVRSCRRRQPCVDVGEAASSTDRSDGGGQLALLRCGVVNVVGRHACEAHRRRQLGERVVASGVGRVTVIPQLHQHAVTPERVDEAMQFAARRIDPVGGARRWHRTFATAGEYPAVRAGRPDHPGSGAADDVGEGELRRTLLAGEMTLAQHARQSGVAVGAIRQHEQVHSGGVGRVGIGNEAGVDLSVGVAFGADDGMIEQRAVSASGQRDLGTECCGDPDGFRGLGETHHAVEPVMVGDRQGLDTEACCLHRQLFGVRCAVEKREVRVAVQLGVRRGSRRVSREPRWRFEGLAFAAPRRAVATAVPRRRPGRATVTAGARRPRLLPAVGERTFQLAPRPRRVVEPHPPDYRTGVLRTQVRSSLRSPPFAHPLALPVAPIRARKRHTAHGTRAGTLTRCQRAVQPPSTSRL